MPVGVVGGAEHPRVQPRQLVREVVVHKHRPAALAVQALDGVAPVACCALPLPHARREAVDRGEVVLGEEAGQVLHRARLRLGVRRQARRPHPPQQWDASELRQRESVPPRARRLEARGKRGEAGRGEEEEEGHIRALGGAPAISAGVALLPGKKKEFFEKSPLRQKEREGRTWALGEASPSSSSASSAPCRKIRASI